MIATEPHGRAVPLHGRSGALVAPVVAILSVVSAGAEAQSCPATLRQQVLEMINAVRAESNLPHLLVDTRLVASATRHALDMATKDFMDHEGSDGSRVIDRIDDAGYRWRSVSENVAVGQATAQAVFDAWVNSPTHRANILSPTAQHIGIAHAFRDDSEYRHYWTTNFGTTPQVIEAPEDGCHP